MSGDVMWVGGPPDELAEAMLPGVTSVHIGHGVANTPQGRLFMEECVKHNVDVYVLPPGGVIPPEGIKAWRPEC